MKWPFFTFETSRLCSSVFLRQIALKLYNMKSTCLVYEFACINLLKLYSDSKSIFVHHGEKGNSYNLFVRVQTWAYCV